MSNPPVLLLALVGLVGLLWNLSLRPTFHRLFKVLPLPFWCYMVPTLLATLGWLASESPLYPILSYRLLPICLVLLLIGTDLKGVLRLGPLATSLFIAGSLGTILGGLVSFLIFHRWLPDETWAGIGALAASWIGGSANLLAVKEALGVEDSLIGPVILVDALVAYSWMALLILSAGWQDRWNRRVETSKGTGPPRGDGPEGTSEGCAGTVPPPQKWWGRAQPDARVRPPRWGGRTVPEGPPRARGVPLLTPRPWGGLILGILLSILICLPAQWLGSRLPAVGQVLNPQSWTILLVTTAGIGLSLTSLRRLEEAGISRVGTFFLYVLLASIGARANFRAIADSPVFLALGVTWILIHGITLLLAGAFFRAPLGLIATASQANIGGPISAPIVGATFSPRLATLGLMMAILGNILGTYLGLGTAFLARLLESSSFIG